MNSERIEKALKRLAAASERIEAAALKPRPEGDGDLLRRHELLKATATEALNDLDALIGTLDK